jgi:hypothetical protein
MEWEPNHQGLQELENIFKESLGCNNQKHKEICEVRNLMIFNENKIILEIEYLQQKPGVL